ncbi:MAG: hypothetical protein KDJ88_05710 [Bauldia sp.]|nr:hypothetical protein [Bauldia sp.]
MAFVWGIDPSQEMSAQLTFGNNEGIAQAAIGYDDTTEDTISVFVALSPLAGGDYEHVFAIIAADPQTAGEYQYWDGAETKNLFNQEDRESVLKIICGLTQALLAELTPPKVYHYTHEPNLPAKALSKHQVVMGVFRNNGYEVRLAQPHHGQQCWIAEMRSEATVAT